MRIRNIILGVSVALLASETLLPPPAHAWRATETTLRSTRDAVRSVREEQARTTSSVREVRQEVRDSTTRLIEVLRLHAAEGSAYADKQIEAQRRFMDAAEVNQSERLRQEFRARAESGEFDPSPGICLLAGLFRGGGGGTAGALGTQVTQVAVSETSGVDPAVRQGGTALARSVIDRRREMQGRLGVQDPTVDPAAILANPTIGDSQEDQAALAMLVRNMVDPLPPRPVSAAEAMTPEGVTRAHRRTIQETRNNASRELTAMLVNMRTPVQPVGGAGGGGTFAAYLEDIANYNRPVGDRISELQAIDIRTLRHYAPKPEIFRERATMSERALLQEILDALSINNRLLYISLELDSRRAAVETQILSALNN